jgi:hypothetical protein
VVAQHPLAAIDRRTPGQMRVSADRDRRKRSMVIAENGKAIAENGQRDRRKR